MKLWEDFLHTLETELGAATVDLWLRPLKILSYQEGVLKLQAKDSFQALWFEEHVRALAQARLIDHNVRVKVEISLAEPPDQEKGSFPKKKRTKVERAPQASLELAGDAIDPQSHFERIYEYENNRFAKSALKNLSQDPLAFAGQGYNPLYIYGPSGSGKTALLMATAKELEKTGKKVLYVTGETFTQHVVQAIRLGNMQEFRKFYRGVDVLIVDGVEIFSHKPATQEEFFHTFNSLHVEAKAIVVSSSHPPKDLKDIEPRLVSRFEWGLMAQLLPAQDAELFSLLETQTKFLKLPLSTTQSKWLIERFGSSVKILMKALTALALRSHRQKSKLKSLAPSEMSELLRDIEQELLSKALTADKLVQIVSDYYGVTTKDLLGKCQSREFSLPRQVAMYLCRERLSMPFLKIASLFGRDHSTVMASCKLILKQTCEKSSRVYHELPAICQKL